MLSPKAIASAAKLIAEAPPLSKSQLAYVSSVMFAGNPLQNKDFQCNADAA